MYIRSTGLGKTLLKAKISRIELTNIIPGTLEQANGPDEPMRFLVTMDIVEPVHWTVRAFAEPSDLKHMLRIVLTNPALIFRGLQFLFSKEPKSEPKGVHAQEARL